MPNFDSFNNSNKLLMSDMDAHIEAKYNGASLFMNPDMLRVVDRILPYHRGEKFMSCLSSNLVQLDCPSDGHWDLVGRPSPLGPISNLRPFLDFSALTTRGNILDFFVNPKNGLV